MLRKSKKFVELRAKGMSFERIAEEIKVSKPTLIKWSEELFHEVQEAQFYELEPAGELQAHEEAEV